MLNVDDLLDFSDEKNIVGFNLSKEDRDRLKKTSIDFTFCDKNDSPILCIEFDGICHGFNLGKSYFSHNKAIPWRHEITDLKLKVAHGSSFPFFVMGSPQFQSFDSTDKIAIVDCLIGAVLYKKKFSAEIELGIPFEKYNTTEEEFSMLPHEEKISFIEWWGVKTETKAEFESNPIFKITYDLIEKLGVKKWTYGPLNPPELENIDSKEERMEIIKRSQYIGAFAKINLPNGKQYAAEIWIPDFNVPGYSPYSFIFELALYLALKKADRKGSKHKTPL